jgi:hypothetical protein
MFLFLSLSITFDVMMCQCFVGLHFFRILFLFCSFSSKTFDLMEQLVLLYPSSSSPTLLNIILATSPEQRQRVKLQAVGARNCPVAQLKVNAAIG